MPALSGPTAVAGRVLLSTLWSSEGVDYEEEAVSLLPVRIPDLGHSGDDIAGHPKASEAVVPSHVAHNQPEVWCQCFGASKGLGAEQVRNGVGVAAQVAHGYGVTCPVRFPKLEQKLFLNLPKGKGHSFLLKLPFSVKEQLRK